MRVSPGQVLYRESTDQGSHCPRRYWRQSRSAGAD